MCCKAATMIFTSTTSYMKLSRWPFASTSPQISAGSTRPDLTPAHGSCILNLNLTPTSECLNIQILLFCLPACNSEGDREGCRTFFRYQYPYLGLDSSHVGSVLKEAVGQILVKERSWSASLRSGLVRTTL